MTVISKLFKPTSVAIVGASGDASKTSGRPVAYLQKHGYDGRIYPVNPRIAKIGDLQCWPDIAALPEVPEVAIVLLSAERAHFAVKELAERGTSAAIVLASGYAETGEEGAARQSQLLAAAGQMRILGPNTIGLVNLTDDIILSATGAMEMERFSPGNIAVVSQSGGILGSLLSRAAARGIGLSKLISTSNEMDLEMSDFIDALVDDEATQVIALYIEGVRHPEKFRAAAIRALKAGKPIVAFKIGRSEAGAKAAVSHTGAMAGSDQMYDALFRQLGIIRAQTFGDLLDISVALSTKRVLRGHRIAVLTSTGGAGTLVSDSLGVSGFTTPPPDAETAMALRALQTGDHAALDRNPIDVTLAGLQPELLRRAIKILLDSPSYDALTVILGSSSVANPELMTHAIQANLSQTDKPVIAYVSPHAPRAIEMLNHLGVPAFAAAESCTVAMAAMIQVRALQERSAEFPADTGSGLIAKMPEMGESFDIREFLQPNDLSNGALNEAQSKQLFARFGIPCTLEQIVETAEQAERAAIELGGQVVLKVLSNRLMHKSDVGGVAVGLKPGIVGERLEQMAVEVEQKAGFKPTRFLVQAMVPKGIEMILGMRKDPLGVAILLGIGGVSAELFKDTSMRLLNVDTGLSRAEARDMVCELKTWPLLNGYRGRPAADVEALLDAMMAFSKMALKLQDRVREAEINPLFVMAKDSGTASFGSKRQGVLAADGVVILERGLS
jgi:acetate---CoA ligase (ADP-forming)